VREDVRKKKQQPSEENSDKIWKGTTKGRGGRLTSDIGRTIRGEAVLERTLFTRREGMGRDREN